MFLVALLGLAFSTLSPLAEISLAFYRSAHFFVLSELWRSAWFVLFLSFVRLLTMRKVPLTLQLQSSSRCVAS
jgi:hypothetical protein